MSTKPVSSEHDLTSLSTLDQRLGAIVRDPRFAVYGAVVLAAALGWTYLALMVLGTDEGPGAAAFGPGMQIFQSFGDLELSPLLAAICQPIGLSGTLSFTFSGFGLTFAMWAMMVLAMMLPTAAPMLSTYATLADTARKKNERAVSAWVLAAGYLVVWLSFSVAAALAQIAMSQAGSLTATGTPATLAISATVLFVAAVYQFTPAKHACLTKCQNPFMYFFGNWTDCTAGIFKIGLIQGLYCLGCCWALMAVMFAVGVMNLVWVAFLCALMVIEKTLINPWMSRAIGLFLFVLACALVAPLVMQGFIKV